MKRLYQDTMAGIAGSGPPFNRFHWIDADEIVTEQLMAVFKPLRQSFNVAIRQLICSACSKVYSEDLQRPQFLRQCFARHILFQAIRCSFSFV